MHVAEKMATQQFETPTRDGQARLRGQIDLPTAAASRVPAVVMVNGGWFMDRDGYMGESGTPRDLIYRDLAHDIVAAGVAVVRYDNRGVRCNEMTMPPCPKGASEWEISKHYVSACIDSRVRRTVTVQSQMDDVEDVWRVAAAHPRIESQRIVVWAHSEGGLNVARLISARRICPLGVILVGAAAESPAACMRAQMVDHRVQRLMDWDANGDGVVTQADVDRRYPTDDLFPTSGIQAETLTAPPGGWTLATAQEHFSRIYDEAKAAALARPDDAPYPDPTPDFPLVAASNNWYRQWFEDARPMIDHFAEYRGHVSFHLGEIDSQAPGRRQMAAAESRIQSGIFARPPRLVLHQGRGHSLRTGAPAAGPMDDEAKAIFVEEIHEILRTG